MRAYPPLRRERPASRDSWVMPFVVSGNVKLFFEESGSGYPIIFLHEFESDSRGWQWATGSLLQCCVAEL
jgi:pimeloyl-ACP methyl ester carboxylesterase